MKKPFFGVYFVAEGQSPVLCEVDGGVSYEAHATKNLADASAKRANEFYIERGKAAPYVVQPIPAGVRVWDAENDCEVLSGSHAADVVCMPADNAQYLAGEKALQALESSNPAEHARIMSMGAAPSIELAPPHGVIAPNLAMNTAQTLCVLCLTLCDLQEDASADAIWQSRDQADDSVQLYQFKDGSVLAVGTTSAAAHSSLDAHKHSQDIGQPHDVIAPPSIKRNPVDGPFNAHKQGGTWYVFNNDQFHDHVRHNTLESALKICDEMNAKHAHR